MQRNRALCVVQAATRFKVLAEKAKRRLDSAGNLGDASESLVSNGDAPGLDLEHELLRPGSLLSLRSFVQSLPPEPESCTNTLCHDLLGLRALILSSPVNVLLVCIPLGFASYFLSWGAVSTFALNFLALIPLALILGDITEDLARRFGDVVGGLLNATFGNVVEIILSVAALLKGLYTVVAMSLLGSILSNLLLVLGCCFLFGGLRYKRQEFNQVANKACNSLLFLSCIGIIIPTAVDRLLVSPTQDDPPSSSVLSLSRGTAVLLLALYLAYLTFQLYTHADLFAGEEDSDDDNDDELFSLTTSLCLLAGITVIVAICSEFLTGAIEEVSVSTGLSEAFLGIIVLPIAGNACEHITAVLVAYKNKMDLALGVAVGSSIQIALFALPFIVLVGWATGHPMDLDFDPFAVLALTVSVIHANFVTADGNSHWLMGVQLIVTYCLVALGYLYK